jgi:hypothetical protein
MIVCEMGPRTVLSRSLKAGFTRRQGQAVEKRAREAGQSHAQLPAAAAECSAGRSSAAPRATMLATALAAASLAAAAASSIGTAVPQAKLPNIVMILYAHLPAHRHRARIIDDHIAPGPSA